MYSRSRWCVPVLVAAWSGLVASAEPPRALGRAPDGSPAAREALALCVQPGGDPARWKRGVALAEQAIEAHDADATAHFAVFCNLGKQADAAGVSMTGMLAVRRLRREIDRTLALAPDWDDALVAKGSFLMQLPRMLGGDAAEGERLLRRVLTRDPDFHEAHFELARGLAANGRRADARVAAERAVALADRAHDADVAERARKLLRELGD